MKWISNVPNKEFNVMVIKMLTRLRRRIDEHSENFNKELENIKKTQSERKKSITKIKNTLEGMNSTLSNTEECINELEYRIVKITHLEQQKEKQTYKMKTV